MKTVKVVAAVIRSGNKVFATQRGYGEFKDGWELNVIISVEEKLKCVEYDYPSFHLSMDCYWAKINFGELVLKEHEAGRWLSWKELDSVDWLPADLGLVEEITKYLRA